MDKIEIKENADTALWRAVTTGDLEIVKAALAAGANPNKGHEDSPDYKVLHAAAACGHTEVVYELLEAGACPHSKSYDETPRRRAANNNYKFTADILYFYERGAKAWEKTSEREIRKTRIMNGGKIILTDLFNFEDKICISIIQHHHGDIKTLREFFNRIPAEPVQQARKELEKLGGNPGVAASDLRPLKQ